MKRIVLTGGDLSGKTTIWEQIPPRLKQKILMVPEMASALMSKAFPVIGTDVEVTAATLAGFQNVMLPAQMFAENAWGLVAAAQSKKAMLYDRGIWDMAAYDPRGKAGVMDYYQLSESTIDARYDYIILLRSLAKTNPEEYLRLQSSNPARIRWSVNEMIAIDDRIYQAWKDHPGLIEMDGTRGIDYLVKAVSEFLGVIIGKEVERKFLLPRGLPDNWRSNFRQVIRTFQDQYYLVTSPGEQRARRTEVENGPISFCFTTKSDGSESRDEHIDEDYTKWAYNQYLPHRQGHLIKKTRDLAQADRLYEIDRYHEPGEMTIVEQEYGDEAEARTAILPDWMVRAGAIDVTRNPAFKAKSIAINGLPDLSAF